MLACKCCVTVIWCLKCPRRSQSASGCELPWAVENGHLHILEYLVDVNMMNFPKSVSVAAKTQTVEVLTKPPSAVELLGGRLGDANKHTEGTIHSTTVLSTWWRYEGGELRRPE